MIIHTTKDLTNSNVKLVVYGQSGVGKTSLIPSLPNPFIINIEKGLISIKDINVPYVNVGNKQELIEVYKWLLESNEANKYDSVAIDSLSEIADIILSDYQKDFNRDARKSYPMLTESVSNIIRNFRDGLNKHVYFIAHQGRTQDETGRLLYNADLPGKLSLKLTYFFNEVFAMRIIVNQNNENERWLMCQPDGTYEAKDRSNELQQFEPPHLGNIIEKILKGKKGE